MKKQQSYEKPDNNSLLRDFILKDYSGKDLAKLLKLLGVKIVSYIETFNKMREIETVGKRTNTGMWYTMKSKSIVPNGDKYVFYEVVKNIFGDDFYVLWETNMQMLPEMIADEKAKRKKLYKR